MSSPVLVTGGSGTLGRLVVPRLRDAGLDVRVLSRSARLLGPGVEVVTGDLMTGEGVRPAVDGVETVLHLAGTAKDDDVKARTLTQAAAGAGVRHLVYISVVGADRVPVTSPVDRAMFGYFASKRAAELVVESSGVPFTTLRASQFHELLLLAVGALAKSPVVPVPRGFRFQPVAAAEVADRLVELVRQPPSGLVPDLAGPGVHGMDDLVRGYLAATGRRRVLVPVPMPGGAARAVRSGANLAPDHADGHQTWADFLTQRVPNAAAGVAANRS